MVVQKRRFLLFEALFETAPRTGTILEEHLLTVIREALAVNWGDLGEAQAHMRMVYWSEAVNLGIVRCSREAAEHVWSAITMVTSVGNRPVQFRVHRIGGTIRAIQDAGKELLHTRKHRALAQTTTQEEADTVREGFNTEVKLLTDVGMFTVALPNEWC